jgi:hypothetical protein
MEEKMARSVRGKAQAIATPEELTRLLGHIDPATAAKVLELRPTLAELEEVAMWLTGQGNVPDRAGHPLMGNAAAIYEMIAPNEANEER